MEQKETNQSFKSGFLDRTPEEKDAIDFPESLDDYSRTLSFIGPIRLYNSTYLGNYLRDKYFDKPEDLDKYLSKRILKRVEDGVLEIKRDEVVGHVQRLEYLLESLGKCEGEKMFTTTKTMDRLAGWKKARSILKQELSKARYRRDEFLKSKDFKLRRLGEE
ncbi:hypothetical protein [Reichenbachiella sp.]|uniref:hypothetical protein n=1 Tax=Reichenbachiella sp. TaxID=2184521 RepID=UPI003B5921C5